MEATRDRLISGSYLHKIDVLDVLQYHKMGCRVVWAELTSDNRVDRGLDDDESEETGNWDGQVVVKLLKRCFDFRAISSVLSRADPRGSFQNVEGATYDVVAPILCRIWLMLFIDDDRLLLACFLTVNDFIIMIPLRFALVSFDIYTFLRLLEKGLVE